MVPPTGDRWTDGANPRRRLLSDASASAGTSNGQVMQAVCGPPRSHHPPQPPTGSCRRPPLRKVFEAGKSATNSTGAGEKGRHALNTELSQLQAGAYEAALLPSRPAPALARPSLLAIAGTNGRARHIRVGDAAGQRSGRGPRDRHAHLRAPCRRALVLLATLARAAQPASTVHARAAYWALDPLCHCPVGRCGCEPWRVSATTSAAVPGRYPTRSTPAGSPQRQATGCLNSPCTTDAMRCMSCRPCVRSPGLSALCAKSQRVAALFPRRYVCVYAVRGELSI